MTRSKRKRNFETGENGPKSKKQKTDSDSDYWDEQIINEAIGSPSFELLARLKVRKYALNRLETTAAEHKAEIDAMEKASSAITPPSPCSDSTLKQQQLWSKFIASEILKQIFELSAGEREKTVLSLVLVCKDWRVIIHSQKPDSTFGLKLWAPVLNRLRPLDWKHFVLVPDHFLRRFIHVEKVRPMTDEECKHYDKLVGVRHDEGSCNQHSNIPLLIAAIYKCPNLTNIDVDGQLCEDLFFAIGNQLRHLQELEFRYSDGKCEWLEHLVFPGSQVCKSLLSVCFERSWWIDDEAYLYLSHCSNLRYIYAEKPCISAQALEFIFNGCTELHSISLVRPYFQTSLAEAFKILAEKNKVIERIEIDDARGFDDDCLGYLMDDNACPKLKRLSLNYADCTSDKKKEFKEKRRGVRAYIYIGEQDDGDE